MHCTSPGNLIPYNPKAKDKNVHDIVPEIMQNTSIDLDQRTYDDPCELVDEWSSPIHIPRSRSWLCCPHATIESAKEEPKLNRRLSCEYSYLVTEAPKPQFGNVFCQQFFHTNNQVNPFFYNSYYSFMLLLYPH